MRSRLNGESLCVVCTDDHHGERVINALKALILVIDSIFLLIYSHRYIGQGVE